MCFKRSTQDIVSGGWFRKRKKEEISMENTEEALDHGTAEITVQKNGNLRKNLPFLIATGCGVILGLLVLILLILPRGGDAVQDTTPSTSAALPDDAYIMVIPAEGMVAAGEIGDILQVFGYYTDENGNGAWQPVDSLRYLEICAMDAATVSVYMTETQLADYLALGGKCAPALVARGGKEAQELLAWQQHFNAPTITLKLAEVSKTVPKGSKAQLELAISVEPEEAYAGSVLWASSDETVATVDENGMVTALEAGNVEITATCRDISTKCTITVYPVATEIYFDEEQAVVNVGGTVQITAEVRPEGLDDPVIWASSDEAVATVSEDGTVTGINAGEATITAICGDVSAKCLVSVQIPAEEIQLSDIGLALTPGQVTALQAVILPENTTDTTVVWASSDEAVVTVAEDGTVTAIAAGTAEITAVCGNAKAVCTITVQ